MWNYTSVSVTSGGEGKVTVSWTSEILTITITGAFDGTATIHCEASGWDDFNDVAANMSRDVYVTCVANPAIDVTGVTLSQTSAELTAGGAALELTPTVAPAGATDKTVTWSVVQDGSFVALFTDQACTQAVGTDAIDPAKVYVKPLAAGQATVTVTTSDGGKTATCTVTVAPAEIASGTTGDVAWTLTDDGKLTISGTGAMEDNASATAQPWKNYRSSITSIVVGDGVTRIGNFAFTQCSKAESISLPSSLTSIGTRAFQNCNNASLTSITIPANVETIGDYAFSVCSKLTSVTIPDKVTFIGSNAFASCSGLTSITIPDNVETIGNNAFNKCSGLQSATIGNGVTSIGESTFNGCTSMTTLTIGSSVETIGISAFEGCTQLGSVAIPNSVTSIGKYAFIACI